jgi:hypothetical protein
MRRPEARAFFLCFLACSGLATVMLGASAMESSEGAVYRNLGLAFGGLCVVTGALAAVFRFTEPPRAVILRDCPDWAEPPVLHTEGPI